MIALYLKSLAATVRDLVASGKAVHVTHETAPELDLLAELPWKDCLKEVPPTDDPCVMDVLMLEPITLADLAFGWLLTSRAQICCEGRYEITNKTADRAAECAELALISVALLPRFEKTEPGVLQSHQGTREGARAAWGFVAMKLTRSADSIKENMRKPDANTDCCVSRLKLNRVADRYRRELEAM